MNRLPTTMAISIGVVLLSGVAAFALVDRLMARFAPETPAVVQSITTITAAITAAAIVGTFTFVALRFLAALTRRKRPPRAQDPAP